MQSSGPKSNEFLYSAAIVLLCSASAAIVSTVIRQPPTLLMIYTIGVVYAATKFSERATYFTCLLSVVAYDLCFLNPRGQLSQLDRDSTITLAVVLAITVVIARMSATTRREFKEAVEREAETQLIYNLSCDLANAREVQNLASIANSHISKSFARPTSVFVIDENGVLQAPECTKASPDQLAAAKMCFERKDTYEVTAREGHGGGIYFPLRGSMSVVGVLAITGSDLESIPPYRTRLLETLANQTALAIERSIHWETAERRKMTMETIKMRNALLSSVSHDLRTPLAAIMGAASVLKEDANSVSADVTHELAQSIYGEADRLNRFLLNLLDMTRMESGSVKLHKEWNSVEEVFGAAISRTRDQLAPYKIVTKIPADLPLVLMDALLIEQVLVNLLDNAAKYSIAATEIVLEAEPVEAAVNFSVLNHGQGIAEGEEEKIFDKFFRSAKTGTISGAGLGLTICRSIVQFHGGKIWAERLPKATRFVFSLPATEEPPSIVAEEVEVVG